MMYPKQENLRGQKNKVKGGVLGYVECSRKEEGGDPGMLMNTREKGYFLIKAWRFLLGEKGSCLKGRSLLFQLHVLG